MANDVPLVDYYSVLNLPHRADLAGIENAYARLSHEFAIRGDVDDTARDALEKVNEAYSVLSKPELRREYDQEFFREELVASARRARNEARRRDLVSGALVGGLGLIVVVQACALVYIGHDEALSLFRAIADVIA